MSTATLLVSLIELVVFLVPVITIIARWATWKTKIENKLAILETNDKKQDEQYENILSTMNNIQMSIVRLETKLNIMEKE